MVAKLVCKNVADICLSYILVSVSAIQWYRKGFSVPYNDRYINIYILRVKGCIGSTCHKGKVNAAHKMELSAIQDPQRLDRGLARGEVG